MTDAATSTALAFYAAHGCALFPMPYGSKSPVGIISSWKHDHSNSPEQWARWQSASPSCNFGVVASASRWIIVDVDVSELGRDRAWQLWGEWCASNGLPVYAPYCQSARGGWHIAFQLPADCDPTALTQRALIGPTDGSKKAIIDTRVEGFTVAAGSYYDGTARQEASGAYILLSDAAPHPAPAALIAHCTRATSRSAQAAAVGTLDAAELAALISWMAERDALSSYEDWLNCGMSLKLELGDEGRTVWARAHDATVTPDVEESKWNSFSDEPTPGCVTILSIIDRARKLGWRGTIRKSGTAMFGGQVQAIASAAGASLPGQGGIAMIGREEKLTEFGAPMLADFLASTRDGPTRPLKMDYPQLPEAASSRGLYVPLVEAVDRIFALAEEPTKWNGTKVIDACVVLSLVHADCYESVCRKLRTLGLAIPEAKIKAKAAALADVVDREFVPKASWQVDNKGEPQNDNSDNVEVFKNIIDAEIRWNAWLECAEIRGGTGVSNKTVEWPDWTYIDDAVLAKLHTRACRTGTRFRPGDKFFWQSILSISYANTFDPVIDRLDALQWDGIPRLSIWLSRACGVPCDPYHQAVGRNIIGGAVKRARHAGVKHDTMPVFYGPQGTGKSTLAEILSLNREWFSDTIKLGDESKELVLSLAGKMIVEIGEMGTRSSADANSVKAMVSRTTDRGRTAYARTVSARPRRNIFIGTTNDSEPLTDPTGNRRFLPIHIASEIDLDWMRANVEQIYAEACVLETNGTSFDLPRSVWSIAAEHQEAARSESDTETLLEEWFGDTTYPTTYIVAADLVHLATLAGWRSNSAKSAFMKKLGFRSATSYVIGRKTRLWVRGPMPLQGAVRYMVGQDGTGRPRVTISAHATSGAPLPPPPHPAA